jgi:hypothetical protein
VSPVKKNFEEKRREVLERKKKIEMDRQRKIQSKMMEKEQRRQRIQQVLKNLFLEKKKWIEEF